MFVEVYIVSWNEEKILPFVLDHYAEFCDRIVLLDNWSDDSSYELIAKGSDVNDCWKSQGRWPVVNIKQWDSLQEEDDDGNFRPVYDERVLTHIKENCFQLYGEGADWVMVVDADEFYYHPNMRDKLREYMNAGINYPLVEGFEMVSKNFPKYQRGSFLVDQVKTGWKETGMDKRCIFDPRVAMGNKLCFGSHGLFMREDLAVENDTAEIKLLHYKDLSADYKIERRKLLRSRRSKWTTDEGLCAHWDQSEEHIREQLKKKLEECEEVI